MIQIMMLCSHKMPFVQTLNVEDKCHKKERFCKVKCLSQNTIFIWLPFIRIVSTLYLKLQMCVFWWDICETTKVLRPKLVKKKQTLQMFLPTWHSKLPYSLSPISFLLAANIFSTWLLCKLLKKNILVSKSILPLPQWHWRVLIIWHIHEKCSWQKTFMFG